MISTAVWEHTHTCIQRERESELWTYRIKQLQIKNCNLGFLHKQLSNIALFLVSFCIYLSCVLSLVSPPCRWLPCQRSGAPRWPKTGATRMSRSSSFRTCGPLTTSAFAVRRLERLFAALLSPPDMMTPSNGRHTCSTRIHTSTFRTVCRGIRRMTRCCNWWEY